jgi:mannosyl-oligosaccharide glucosidase
MGEISEFLDIESDREEYLRHEKGILANLDGRSGAQARLTVDLHWSEEEQMYCDVSVNEEGLSAQYVARDRDWISSDESIHVCHKGYISLFPFLLGLLPPTSPHLTPMLDLITSSTHLWSSYGIRSLSRSHPLFGKDENYWRGPIWMQMNWLALKSLKERYVVEEGSERERAKEVYAALRTNVVENVFNVSPSSIADLASWRRVGVEENGVRLGAVWCGDWGGATKVGHSG